MKKLLQDLTDLVGPSGFEHEIARVILERVKPLADEVTIDGLGNIIARVRGQYPGPTLLVSAHMDEIGFIVKKIEENGLIRFEKLGGHDDRILLAQQVRIQTESGVRLGVIGTISAHMVKFDDPVHVRQHRDLYIDVGADSRNAVERLGIQVGDPISWATQMQMLGDTKVVGKAFDDRAGCAVLIQALQELNASDMHGEVCAVFSVQEEVGLRGAKVAGEQVAADVSIAIDTTAVSDTPEQMMDSTLRLGYGPCIKVMDQSLIASRSVRKELEEAAKAAAIPYQHEIFMGIGTDAGALHQSRGGVPSGVISIPSRYAHSPVEVMDLNDLIQAKDLLKQFIYRLRSKEQFRFID
jgi:putative aminopeptidase FrvX